MVFVAVPPLGEGIEKTVVSCWYVKVGDRVNDGDDIVELAVDKATFDVPATASGRLTKILVGVGQEAKIGEALAVIE